MRRILAVVALVVLASAGPVVPPSEAAAGAALAPCGTVTRSTTLRRDCLGPMIVGADTIKVDLGGRAVVCTSAVDGIVLEGRSRVSIVKGHVHGCDIGVRIDGGSRNTLDGLHIDGNAWQGILIRGSSSNVARSTQVLRNGTLGREFSRGVMIRPSVDGTIPSDGNVLDRVTANENIAYGIEIRASSNNRLTSVRADGNAAGGIAIDGGAAWTTITSSSGSNNGGFGLYVSGADNSITSSSFKSNTGSRGYGAQLVGTAVRTTIDRNAISGNVLDGMRISGRDNVVSNNTLVGNGRHGIAVGNSEEAAGPGGNRLTGNTASGAAPGSYDLADFVAGQCTANVWQGNSGVRLYDGCEAD